MSEVSVAEGYIFSGITHEPEKVQIQGEAEDLTQIREIVIPAGELTENDVADKILVNFILSSIIQNKLRT